MLKNKRAVGAIVLAFFVLCGCFFAFSPYKTAVKLREGVRLGIEDDFKIRESIGKVFLIDAEVPVSGGVSVESLILPVNADFKEQTVLGDKVICFETERLAPVFAVADGKIENITDEKITLRHNDGMLSVYNGAGCLLSKGATVKRGEHIAYSEGKITYKLYDNCVAVDPLLYISH